MEATVQLPQALAHRLEELAEEEGTSLDSLIRRMVSEHVGRRAVAARKSASSKGIRLPLIQIEETGVIQPVTGADLDRILTLDDLASGR